MAFAATNGGRVAWVTAPAENKLIQLDLVKGDKVGEVSVPGEPHGMVLSPDGKRVYVVQRKLHQIAVVDTESRRVVKTAAIGKRPDMVAMGSNGRTLFVVSRGENRLLRLSAADLSVTGEAATGKEPHGVAYRP